jgi:hypothetical protein
MTVPDLQGPFRPRSRRRLCKIKRLVPLRDARSSPTNWAEAKSVVNVTEAEICLRVKAAVMVAEILVDNMQFSSMKPEIDAAKEHGDFQAWTKRYQAALAKRFDHKGMRHACAVWRRWTAWRADQAKVPTDAAAAPEALNLALFLDDVAGKGPTAAWGVLTGMRWLAKNIGMHRLPLDSPLLMNFAAPGKDQIQKQAKEMTAAIWKHIEKVAEGDAGAVALMAKVTMFLAVSSLRFRHAQRASLVHGECTGRTLVIEVKKGKVNRGAPFKLAVPTHIAEGKPMFTKLFEELESQMGSPGFIVPDVNMRRTGCLSPECPLTNRPMSYNKYMGCIRALVMMEPLALSLAEARDFTTYSLRRKMPTIADRLRLPMCMRAELGNWQEAVDVGSADHKRVREPMAVRYSAARLESAAQTRRVCLTAMNKAKTAVDEDEATRTMADKVSSMIMEVLSDAWGTDKDHKEAAQALAVLSSSMQQQQKQQQQQ